MKNMNFLALALSIFLFQACNQNKTDTTAATPNTQTSVASNDNLSQPDRKVFENLDVILSPFEDMTEDALNHDEAGISKAMNKVEKAKQDGYFAKNLSAENLNSLQPKIDSLKQLVAQKEFNKIALASTEIFEYNISNFKDIEVIQSQIHIEHMDYMGFKVLALLKQDQVEWAKIEQTVSNSEKEWDALTPKIKDPNLTASFNYLFEGLHETAKNKNMQMSRILADMDLSLVDVLENSI